MKVVQINVIRLQVLQAVVQVMPDFLSGKAFLSLFSLIVRGSFGRQHHLIPQVMEGQPLPDHHLRQRQIPGIPPSVYICRIDEVSSFPDIAIHNRQRSLLVHPAGKRPRSEGKIGDPQRCVS